MNNLQNFQSEHLFLLVGTNPLPNYVAAKLLRKPDAKVYFVHTDETLKIAQRLAELLGLSKETKCFIPVLESNIDDVFDEVSSICKKLGDQEVGLNYTGGTKTMVVHAYRAVEKICHDPVFSYLDARSLKMIIERRDQPCLEFPVSLSIKPKIQNLLELHGYTLKQHDPTDQPLQLDVCRELVKIPCKELRKWCDNYLRDDKNSLKKSKKELNQIILPVEPPFDKVASYWQGCKTLGELSTQWDMKVKELSKWLDGLWLESYTLGALQQIANDCQIHQCGMNFEPNERDFEFDVAAMHGYQLFAISCTTGSNKGLLKSKLFEAYVRARQMGGDEARVGLVCCAPNDNPENNPELIQSEIEETWDAQGKLQVFGVEHLPNLPEYLREWFNSQPQ